ncbi:MAG TPA: PaaI family thioesterase [Xanthobacteraceae bacterium]
MSIETVRAFLEGDKPGFMKLIGLKIGAYTKEKVEGSLEARPEISNRAGVMHGGAIMALADTLGAAGTIANMPEGTSTVTIESKTNFFAAIKIGDTAHAECMPLHRGRTTMVWQTKVTRGDGKLAAVVTQTQLVIPAEPKPR